MQIDEKRIAEIRERLKRLDEAPGTDYLDLLDTVLHQDLPYLLNLIEELKGEQQ